MNPDASATIPVTVVRLNRILILAGIVSGYLLQQPLLTSFLFLLLLPAVLWGRRASLVYLIGITLFPKPENSTGEESPKLMRFNNGIAVILLGTAQVAFLSGATGTGWVLSGIVAVAALLALCGFCFGCFLFYQFNLQRFRLQGK